MVTHSQCVYIMRAIVRTGFNNEIPVPIIYTFKDEFKAGKVAGYSFPVDGLATDFDGTYIIAINRKDTLLNVFDSIAHELTHIWQWENGLQANHDKTFWQKLETVKDELI